MLGRTRIAAGLTLSKVVFGCREAQVSDGAARVRTMHAAYDAGITSFDVAPFSGVQPAEELLGRAIADRRGRVEVLTKVGLPAPDDVPADERRARGRADSVRRAVKASLRRLGVETLDVVHVQEADRRTPFAETFGVLADLFREGRIRAVGVSGFSAAEVREAAAALGSTPLASVQLPYNLLDRRAEAELLPLARERNLAVLAHSPLAEGLLAGAHFQDWPAPRIAEELRATLHQVVRPIARERVTSLAAVSLSWLMARPGVSAVVAGARNPLHVEEIVDGAELRLSALEHDRLTRAFATLDLHAPSPLLVRLLRRMRDLIGR
jgi:aryl-alcohol dehydrogenase-like predicted oxidoreductase